MLALRNPRKIISKNPREWALKIPVKNHCFPEGGRSENGGLGDGDPAGLRGLRHRTRVEK